MKKNIFIINGAAGAGKDTFVDYVILDLKDKHLAGAINYSSVDYIKEIARKAGWDGGKSEKDRKFLSDLKRLCTEYNDLPFNTMIHTVSNFLKDINHSVLFLHIREPAEIERAKIAFGAKTILLKRNSVNPISSNDSDANVFDYKYDIIVNNNHHLGHLKTLAEKFTSDLNGKGLKDEY